MSERPGIATVHPGMKRQLMVAAVCLALAASAAAAPVPKYKPSSRSPSAQDITTPEYGFSRSAPDALTVGDNAPDFTLPRAGGGSVSLSAARQSGPVVLIFYRGHW